MYDIWWKHAVAYQIYPRSFKDSNGDGVGDLAGIISKLDYLSALGINLIWLSPIFQSPNDDNGYDISDYQAVMHEFGTMADFERLLSAVHQRGMRLILDLVVNHTSDEHPWFIESRASRQSTKRDWYLWRDGKADGTEPNNWESIFKGSAWQYDAATEQYYLHLFSVKQPDLNWQNPHVHQAIYQMIRWWLDKGIDGFRLDAISHMKKDPALRDLPNPQKLTYVPSFKRHLNYPGVLDYLDEMCQQTFNHYPDIVTVGEANGVSAKQALDWVGHEHKRINMLFSFEHLSLWADKAENRLDILALKKVLTRWQKTLYHRGWNALFVENHDLPRVVSKWGDCQSYWRESATAIATLYFLLQGTPFIYQGQEIGMTNCPFNHIDELNDISDKNRYRLLLAAGYSAKQAIAQIAKLSRDNARTPMQWDNSAYAGFSTQQPWLKVNPNYVTLNVAEQMADPHSIFNYYRQLIALRASHSLFIEGAYRLILAEHRQIYAYLRYRRGEQVLILVNLSAKLARYSYPNLPLCHGQLYLTNYPVAYHDPLIQLTLRPFEARIYRVK